MGTKEPGARMQFHTVQRFKAMPDYLQIWPGHGAGSACGKALGAIPSTTLGYEKLFNPAFQMPTRGVRALAAGEASPSRPVLRADEARQQGWPGPAQRAAAPVNFDRAPWMPSSRMAGRWSTCAAAASLPSRTCRARSTCRPTTAPMSPTWAGSWTTSGPLPGAAVGRREHAILRALRAIGIDDVPGYFGPELRRTIAGAAGNHGLRAGRAAAAERHTILDVRGKSEYAERISRARGTSRWATCADGWTRSRATGR